MEVGNTVLMNGFTAQYPQASMRYGKLDKKRRYVFLFLGAHSEDEPLKPNEVLEGMGWTFDPARLTPAGEE